MNNLPRYTTLMVLGIPLLLVGACDSGNVKIATPDLVASDGGLDVFPTDLTLDQLLPLNCAADQHPCQNICCSREQVCVEHSCLDLGGECSELWPCPAGYFCDPDNGRCTPGAQVCEYRPPVGELNPKVKWEWTVSPVAPEYNQVMMAPMVANLTDDNGDGKIDRNDIPDVVFSTFTGNNYQSDGVLRVISGDGTGEHFAVLDYRTAPGVEVALADIDNDLIPEIVACASGGGVLAFENDGTFKWKTDGIPCGAPAIADLDADGQPEVISGCNALVGASGAIKWTGEVACTTYSTVADLDEDGIPEVIGGNVVLDNQGRIRWQDAARGDGHIAVADLDGDGLPEIVTASSGDHSLRATHGDGSSYWGPVDINQGHGDITDKCAACGGGPPTIADFDGDGRPEIAAAAGYGYVVFEHDGSPKWFKVTQDLSSRVTGSSVFDFEGDGKAEVVYGDELQLRVYDGLNGDVIFSYCNTSGTLREYPIIVDVDNDDHAEIVIANNNYAFKTCADGSASQTGIRVLSDVNNNWVRTRRIWNQHTYHVTNVDEDGRIPQVEQRNWDNPNLNNFRQNVQPGGLFNAPDLVGTAADSISCNNVISGTVEVKNQGAAKVVAGMKVTIYGKRATGEVEIITTVQTTQVLFPGQTERVSFSAPIPATFNLETIEFYAVVDDDGSGSGNGLHNECDESNNTVTLGTTKCSILD